MVLQNYQKFIVLTSNMIYIVALGVGFKCPRKIHLNTHGRHVFVDLLALSQQGERVDCPPHYYMPPGFSDLPTAL